MFGRFKRFINHNGFPSEKCEWLEGAKRNNTQKKSNITHSFSHFSKSDAAHLTKAANSPKNRCPDTVGAWTMSGQISSVQKYISCDNVYINLPSVKRQRMLDVSDRKLSDLIDSVYVLTQRRFCYCCFPSTAHEGYLCRLHSALINIYWIIIQLAKGVSSQLF